MAKIAIKSEKLTPFGGIFSIMEQFDSTLSSIIDSTLTRQHWMHFLQYSLPIIMKYCNVQTHSMKKSSCYILNRWNLVEKCNFRIKNSNEYLQSQRGKL